MQTAKWMLNAVVAGAMAVPWTVYGEGLQPDPDNVPWARWQARLSFGVSASVWRGLGSVERSGLRVGGLSLMGDYYFSRSVTAGGIASGFRATSGLIVGSRAGAWGGRPGLFAPGSLSVDRRLFDSPLAPYGTDPGTDSGALPYLGVGYSGLSPRGGWSVSADLGLVAFAPGQAVKLGRVVGGTQGLDELMRELRLSPVIQLGVSYSF
jgi:hypothetical protein